jgi:hypothetical protein
VSVSRNAPGHEHDYSVLTTAPARNAGAVTSWADYRECACGDRVPVAVTELSSPVPAPRRELQILHAPMRHPEPEAGR